MNYKLINLPYEYDSLEPYFDEKTMRIHHSKHHQGYVNKLNDVIKDQKNLQNKTVEELLKNLNKIPKNIKQKIINFGGGVYNHNFFWEILKKDVDPSGEILNAINKKFGSLENFKKEFKENAMTLFGSGWTWLVLNKKRELEIVSTLNQDSVISKELIPLIAIDVWEHAYYLRYQNKRDEFIDAFFNVINWKRVNDILVESK
ncbi:MAG: superoxide dismutase [Candidatus Pacearchaeota archaeon]|jgi:Fe-Mn family superoxide dismutase